MFNFHLWQKSASHSITHLNVLLTFITYTLNKTTLKTLIKLPDCRKTTHNYRVMDSVWGLFLLSVHTRPIYPTNFAGNPYRACITATITPILLPAHFDIISYVSANFRYSKTLLDDCRQIFGDYRPNCLCAGWFVVFIGVIGLLSLLVTTCRQIFCY